MTVRLGAAREFFSTGMPRTEPARLSRAEAMTGRRPHSCQQIARPPAPAPTLTKRMERLPPTIALINVGPQWRN